MASNFIFFFFNCEFHLSTGDEINVLLSLTKLFPGLRKLKNTGSDFVVNIAEVSHYTAFVHVSTFMLLVKRVMAVQISIEVPGRHYKSTSRSKLTLLTVLHCSSNKSDLHLFFSVNTNRISNIQVTLQERIIISQEKLANTLKIMWQSVRIIFVFILGLEA